MNYFKFYYYVAIVASRYHRKRIFIWRDIPDKYVRFAGTYLYRQDRGLPILFLANREWKMRKQFNKFVN